MIGCGLVGGFYVVIRRVERIIIGLGGSILIVRKGHSSLVVVNALFRTVL
jgi:hypothetical protein